MAKEDIQPYQLNLALRQEFKLLGLDLKEVMEFTPFDLDLENQRLLRLFNFVQQYRQSGSQAAMEVIAGDYLFPPIFPGISPESDWYRFELWIQGEPIRKTLADILPQTFVLQQSDKLTDEEISEALQQLELALQEAGYGVSLCEGIPPRLVYEYLIETLGDTFELYPGGGWSIDGCSGYCPGCFQRPWCDSGQSLCWPEDEEAGKLSLIEALNPYVSASPQSLSILQRLQAEADAQYEKFKTKDNSFDELRQDEDWKIQLN